MGDTLPIFHLDGQLHDFTIFLNNRVIGKASTSLHSFKTLGLKPCTDLLEFKEFNTFSTFLNVIRKAEKSFWFETLKSGTSSSSAPSRLRCFPVLRNNIILNSWKLVIWGWRFQISNQKNWSAWAFWQTFDFSAKYARKRYRTLPVRSKNII